MLLHNNNPNNVVSGHRRPLPISATGHLSRQLFVHYPQLNRLMHHQHAHQIKRCKFHVTLHMLFLPFVSTVPLDYGTDRTVEHMFPPFLLISLVSLYLQELRSTRHLCKIYTLIDLHVPMHLHPHQQINFVLVLMGVLQQLLMHL